jgi:hypothetical protein
MQDIDSFSMRPQFIVLIRRRRFHGKRYVNWTNVTPIWLFQTAGIADLFVTHYRLQVEKHWNYRSNVFRRSESGQTPRAIQRCFRRRRFYPFRIWWKGHQVSMWHQHERESDLRLFWCFEKHSIGLQMRNLPIETQTAWFVKDVFGHSHGNLATWWNWVCDNCESDFANISDPRVGIHDFSS